MDAGDRATPGAVAEGWGEAEQRNSALILDRLIPGGVSFSRREKGLKACRSAHYLPFFSVKVWFYLRLSVFICG